MSTSKADSHNELIMDQFTKQAVPFAEIRAHSGEETINLLVKMTGMNKTDSVLDVACGPGLLACALAPFVQRITGIDLVPVMIEKAQKAQQEKNLSNIDWKIGDVLPLPFEDSLFSVTVSRYAFHHFLKPEAALKEMVRVTKPQGKVVVIDVFTSSSAQSDAYDKVEKLRDPSHTRTLTLTELQSMISKAGLANAKAEFYSIEIELEQQLKASFPKNPEDIDKIRQAVIADVDKNELGWGAHRKDNSVYLKYPIVILVGNKP